MCFACVHYNTSIKHITVQTTVFGFQVSTASPINAHQAYCLSMGAALHGPHTTTPALWACLGLAARLSLAPPMQPAPVVLAGVSGVGGGAAAQAHRQPTGCGKNSTKERALFGLLGSCGSGNTKQAFFMWSKGGRVAPCVNVILCPWVIQIAPANLV